MKIIIERSNLIKALGHVQSVVERKGTIPILSNVKLEAEGAELTLTATDMDIAVAERATANVVQAGSTTVPAQTFYEIVRKLPEGAQVEISKLADSAKITIKAGSSRFSLATLPVEDFPVMNEGELPFSFTITASECSALIMKTRFAVSTEETRYYLNGIYLHATENQGIGVLRAVATDGHRLARIEVALPAGAAGMPGIIIPRKTIGEIVKLIEGGVTQVDISLSESKIRFTCGSAILVSKLIDGTFPDYERVIPTINDRIMELDRKEFARSVDRVSVIASEKTRGIRLSIAQGKLTLSADSPEHGTATEEIDVNFAAEPIEIGFNSRYLLEMTAQMEGDTAQFVFADGSAPAVVRDTADVSALYVIMPMRV
ncbi:MAG: DNA polymerase III subunit beta [Pseudomonadota bacterium]